MDTGEERLNAAQLAALQADSGAANTIGSLLRVDEMPSKLAARTRREILRYLESGDGVVAAQLIHVAIVRHSRGGADTGTRG
jgi:hypothetical protein